MGNHVTDEERERRIERVIELVKSGMTLRQCADYLTKNEFPITYVTVGDYVKRGMKLNKTDAKEASEIIGKHQGSFVENETVRNRIKQVYELLKEGFTIEEVAKTLNTTPMIVYRDFTDRIEKLSEKQLEELGIDLDEVAKIKANFRVNSINNLRNQGTRK